MMGLIKPLVLGLKFEHKVFNLVHNFYPQKSVQTELVSNNPSKYLCTGRHFYQQLFLNWFYCTLAYAVVLINLKNIHELYV